MRIFATLLFLSASAAGVEAAEVTSAYTRIDPKDCRQIEAPDEYVFEGAVLCKGYGGIDIYQAGADARSYAAFGDDAAKHCAAKKTFNPFNTALSPSNGGSPMASPLRQSNAGRSPTVKEIEPAHGWSLLRYATANPVMCIMFQDLIRMPMNRRGVPPTTWRGISIARTMCRRPIPRSARRRSR